MTKNFQLAFILWTLGLVPAGRGFELSLRQFLNGVLLVLYVVCVVMTFVDEVM